MTAFTQSTPCRLEFTLECEEARRFINFALRLANKPVESLEDRVNGLLRETGAGAYLEFISCSMHEPVEGEVTCCPNSTHFECLNQGLYWRSTISQK